MSLQRELSLHLKRFLVKHARLIIVSMVSGVSRIPNEINNCNTCDYHKLDRKHNDEVGAHCYMFRTEPEHVCHQHTERDAPDVQYIASIYASP